MATTTLIPTGEVARRARTSRASVHAAARRGTLNGPLMHGWQGGREDMFHEDDVEDWIAYRSEKGLRWIPTTRKRASNPWAGRDIHAECGSSRWTMPINGDSDSLAWVCLNHPRTVFYRREETDG